MTIISYVCENGDITKDIVVNEAPFDEMLSVFSSYMLPLAKYIDNMHIPPHTRSLSETSSRLFKSTKCPKLMSVRL